MRKISTELAAREIQRLRSIALRRGLSTSAVVSKGLAQLERMHRAGRGDEIRAASYEAPADLDRAATTTALEDDYAGLPRELGYVLDLPPEAVVRAAVRVAIGEGSSTVRGERTSALNLAPDQ